MDMTKHEIEALIKKSLNAYHLAFPMKIEAIKNPEFEVIELENIFIINYFWVDFIDENDEKNYMKDRVCLAKNIEKKNLAIGLIAIFNQIANGLWHMPDGVHLLSLSGRKLN